MDDFELLKVLGTGAYGKVFLVRKLSGHDKGKLYAMKVLRKEIVAQKTKTLDHTRTERKVLEAIRNEPFLVTMHYAFQTKTKLHLILDYVNGGELFTHLYQRDHFEEEDVKIYIGELILALEKLHQVSRYEFQINRLAEGEIQRERERIFGEKQLMIVMLAKRLQHYFVCCVHRQMSERAHAQTNAHSSHRSVEVVDIRSRSHRFSARFLANLH